MTPAHLVFASEFLDDTPIDPAQMTVSSVGAKSGKGKGERSRIKSVFEDLYLDPLDSPIWRSQDQQSDTTISHKEVHEPDTKCFEVKDSAIHEDITLDDMPQNLMKTSSTEETNKGKAATGQIRTDWLGTSQFYTEQSIKLQSSVSHQNLLSECLESCASS